MNPNDLPSESQDRVGACWSLEHQAAAPLAAPIHGIVLGRLLALDNEGTVPLVHFVGPPGMQALRARSTVELHGAHIGRLVVLAFEQGDPLQPIVIGALQGPEGWPGRECSATVDVDADGERMTVTAKERLVLRCGKASITLTKAGKVLIDGAYVVSRSSGVNRIKGGCVQLN